MSLPLSDESIITLYRDRNEQAIAETHRKYGSYCYRIAHNILRIPEDSEECVSDTWLRTWNSIPPDRPGIFRAYLAKITRHLSLDRWRQNTAAKRGSGEMELVLEELAETIPGFSDVEAEISAKELERSILHFIHTLPKRDGDVFLRRYFYLESIADIATLYDITERNCLVILSRTRKKLKDHLEEEGYTL